MDGRGRAGEGEHVLVLGAGVSALRTFKGLMTEDQQSTRARLGFVSD